MKNHGLNNINVHITNNDICGASRQNRTNIGHFKIELGARYDSRSVHLSFLF